MPLAHPANPRLENPLLERESFARRLAVFLGDEAARLGLAAVAVAELDVASGRISPIWRAGAPSLPSPSPRAEDFASWVGAPAVPPDPSVLGPGLEGCEVLLLPLTVRPALSARADAVALLAWRDRPDPAALGALQAALEEGLSAERRANLAEAVLCAVEQADDPIELTDQHGRLFFANNAWERFFGYGPGEWIGRTVGDVFRDPVDSPHDAAFYQHTMARIERGLPWLGTLACRTGGGGRVFCEVNVAPFEAERFRGNFAVRRDIAHRADRDAALINAHKEFRSVLAAIPEGVAVVREGRVYFANAAFLDMVRRTEREVIGLPYLSFVHPDDRGALEETSSTDPRRVQMVTAAGTHRIAEIVVAGSVSFEGQPSTIVLSRDMTDYHIAREQLARSERLSALGSLLAGVAHEINNPLSYVILNLELLRERTSQLGDQTLDALRESIDGAKRIHRIVTELRGFSGSDGQAPPEPVAVVRAATAALNIAQNEIRHRARLERDHEGALYVLAREGELVQVLVNLLVNAAQAIPEMDGREHVISICTRSRAEMVEISVSDTGSGIPSELMPNLFDPFVSGKRRGEGSGLGLAISRRIVEGFGGRIEVRSELGRGTTVFVALPAAAPPSTPQPPAPRGDLPPIRRSAPSARPRVLIVDDEAPIVRALRRVLARFDVTAVLDAQSALDALIAPDADYDVILCDLMMPGFPGSELYRQVCVRRPALGPRFVFMTGGAFTKEGSAFLEEIRPRVLVKPFDPGQLLRLVEEVAASRLPNLRSG